MTEIRVKVTKHSGRKYLIMYYDDPITGRRQQRSTRTVKRRDAERVAAKWEAELREGRYVADTRMTWQQFRERYEDDKLSGLSGAMQSATSTALNHFERIIQPVYLRDVTTALVSRFVSQLRSEGMRATSVAAHVRHLKAVLNWGAKMKYLARPVEFDELADKGRTMMRGRPITDDELTRMLGEVENGLIAAQDAKNASKKPDPGRKRCEAVRQRLRDSRRSRAAAVAEGWKRLLRGLWLSGLRLEEAVKLSWDSDSAFSVDLSGQFPHFRIYAEAHKSRRDELLPMTPDFAGFLLQTPPGERNGRVFPLMGLGGNPVTRSGVIGPAISHIGRCANVVVNRTEGKCASAHDLRRAFGTRWAQRVKPAVLQRLMRHRSLETTLRYYVQLDADDVARELWALP